MSRRIGLCLVLVAACGGDGGSPGDAATPDAGPRQLGDTVLVGEGRQPSLAAGPGGWGLAWVVDLPGGSEVRFARVGADGTVGAGARVDAGHDVRVAGHAGGWGIAMADVDGGGNAQIYLAEASPDGVVGARAPVTDLPFVTGLSFALARVGADWLAVACWEEGGGNDHIIVVPGAGGGPYDEIDATACEEPLLVWDGADVWLAYQRFESAESRYAVWVRRLSPAGAPRGPAVRTSGTDAGALLAGLGAVAGEVGAIYWKSSTNHLTLRRFDAEGAPMGGEIDLDTPDASYGSAAAPLGAAWATVWWTGPEAGLHLYARSFDAAGQARTPATDIATHQAVMDDPSVAALDATLGVAFVDQDGTNPVSIWFARLAGL